MRIVVMRHADPAHPVAIPTVLTGMRIGNPRQAGTAAHVQRYFNAREAAAGLPFSYTFWPDNHPSSENLDAIENGDHYFFHPSHELNDSNAPGESPSVGRQRAESPSIPST